MMLHSSIFIIGGLRLNKSEVYKELLNIFEEKNIFKDELMKSHTSFKIGGPADFFVVPSNMQQLQKVIKFLKNSNLEYYILGNGSNLLVKDEGYRGVIIQVYKNLSNVEIVDTTVKAQAGVLLSTLANKVYKESLTGMEFASGIPGTLGGAVCMNAGAYGGEMKQVVQSVTVINNEGDFQVLGYDELELGYRTSIIQKKGFVVVDVELQLTKGNQEEIKSYMNDLTNRRKTKQPLELASAGSTFKRPTGYYAGKLIMDSGLRGYRIGDAQISEKHCGFVVNLGNAKAEDVLSLISYVQKTVKGKYGVDLEPEVRIIG